MNNVYRSIILTLLFTLGCTKTVTPKFLPADKAKLEEIKKALAEQAQSVNVPPPSVTPYSGLSEAEKKAIVGIRITPPSLTVLEGLSDTVSVIGRQADGREVSLSEGLTFESLSPALLAAPAAAVQSRFSIKGLAPGRGSMNVSYGSLKVNFEVLVKSKEILAIDVFPKSIALGTPTRFRLNVIYDNNTQVELSSGVYWETSSPAFLMGDGTSQSTGIYTGAKVGFGGIQARYAGQSIVSRIEIKMPRIRSLALDADSDSFLIGSVVNIKAIATFATGNSFDISSSVHWHSSEPSVASMGTDGQFEALFPGETQIRATYDMIASTAPFYVTSVNFLDIRLEGNAVTVPAGLSVNYKLWGKKFDNTEVEITSYARWSASNATVLQSGTLESPKVHGKFTGVTPGTATVSASYGIFAKTANLTVSEAAVTSLTMTSENPEGECGINQPQMHVIASLSDGNTKDVTDSVTFAVDPLAAGTPHTDPTKKGLIVTTEAVPAKVIASYMELKTGQTHLAELPLSILPGIELGVGIQAPKTSIPFGETLELKSRQILSCGTGIDYTGSSHWLTDNNSSLLNSYINAVGSKGVLTSASVETPPATTPIIVKVTSKKGTFQGDVDIEVRPKEVKSVSVRAPAVAMDVGTSQAIVLTARYSDSSSVDMIDMSLFPGYNAQYSVTDCIETGCATINAATGVLTSGTKEGIVKIFATLTTPQGYSVISSKVEIKVRSKCVSGTRVGLYCLYKGVRAASCTSTCSAASGTYNAATGTVFGKGGLAADCDVAIKAFGFTNGLETSNLNKGKGLGCSIYEISALSIMQGIRETSTETTEGESSSDFYRICACTVP